MAESNADKLYALGQRLGQHREQLENLRKQVAKDGEMSGAMATMAKQKEAAIKYVQAQYDALAKMPGSKMGEVIQKAEGLLGKEIPTAASETLGDVAARVAGKVGKAALIGGGPIGAGLMAAQEASASENAGPREGEPGYEEESGMNRAGVDLGQIGNGVQSSKDFAKEIGEDEGPTPYNQNTPISQEEPAYFKQQQANEAAVEKADGGTFSDQAMENYKKTHAPEKKGKNGTVSMTETPPANVAKYKKDNKKFENYGDLVGSSDGYKAGGVAMPKVERADIKKIKKLSDGGQPAGIPDSYFADGGVPKSSKKARGAVNTPAPSGIAGMYMAEGGAVSRKLQEGDVVPGEEDQFAGDTVPAMLNKGELVLNVEHQQKLIDKINGRQTSLPENYRVDDLLNAGKASIDKKQQEHLFSFIKGETDKVPTGHIIKYHAEDSAVIPGVSDQSPDDQYDSEDNQSTNAIPEQNQDINGAGVPSGSMASNTLAGKEFNALGGNTQSNKAIQGTASAAPQATEPKAVETVTPQVSNANVNAAISAGAQTAKEIAASQASNQQQNQVSNGINNYNMGAFGDIVGKWDPVIAAAKNNVIQAAANGQVTPVSLQYLEGATDINGKALPTNVDGTRDMKQMDSVQKQWIQENQQQQASQQRLDQLSKQGALATAWADAGTMGKIGLAAALAFSTVVSIKTGTNPVLSYLTQSYNDEISAAGASGAQAQQIKANILGVFASQVQAKLANSTNTSANANAQAALGQALGMKQQAQLQVMGMNIQQRALSMTNNSSLPGQGITNPQLNGMAISDPSVRARAYVKGIDATGQNIFGLANSPESKTNIEEELSRTTPALGQINKLIALADHGKAFPGSIRDAAYKQSALDLATSLNQTLNGTGGRGLNKDMVNFASTELIPQATKYGYFTDNQTERLLQLKSYMQDKANAIIRNGGGVPEQSPRDIAMQKMINSGMSAYAAHQSLNEAIKQNKLPQAFSK